MSMIFTPKERNAFNLVIRKAREMPYNTENLESLRKQFVSNAGFTSLVLPPEVPFQWRFTDDSEKEKFQYLDRELFEWSQGKNPNEMGEPPTEEPTETISYTEAQITRSDEKRDNLIHTYKTMLGLANLKEKEMGIPHYTAIEMERPLKTPFNLNDPNPPIMPYAPDHAELKKLSLYLRALYGLGEFI